MAGVQAWEAQHGTIDAGDVVILFGGWDRHFKPFPEGRAYTIDALEKRGPAWPAPSPTSSSTATTAASA